MKGYNKYKYIELRRAVPCCRLAPEKKHTQHGNWFALCWLNVVMCCVVSLIFLFLCRLLLCGFFFFFSKLSPFSRLVYFDNYMMYRARRLLLLCQYIQNSPDNILLIAYSLIILSRLFLVLSIWIYPTPNTKLQQYNMDNGFKPFC